MIFSLFFWISFEHYDYYFYGVSQMFFFWHFQNSRKTKLKIAASWGFVPTKMLILFLLVRKIYSPASLYFVVFQYWILPILFGFYSNANINRNSIWFWILDSVRFDSFGHGYATTTIRTRTITSLMMMIIVVVVFFLSIFRRFPLSFNQWLFTFHWMFSLV